MGINASPTCVMAYEDAVGYLIGEPNEGMRYMFRMMNTARLSVGLEGLAVGERAYQQAVAYAAERRQGRAVGAAAGEDSPIIEHPDVRRMLLTMKAQIEALRCLAYLNAECLDYAKARSRRVRQRPARQELADLLTPLSKAWGTDLGVELASLAVQVHGGMGFIEETGVAQHYRDIRIAPIYEGTNGIQAIDLVGRKLGCAAAVPSGTSSPTSEPPPIGGDRRRRGAGRDRRAARRRCRHAGRGDRVAARQRRRGPEQRPRRRVAVPADDRHRHRRLAADQVGAGRGGAAETATGAGSATSSSLRSWSRLASTRPSCCRRRPGSPRPSRPARATSLPPASEPLLSFRIDPIRPVPNDSGYVGRRRRQMRRRTDVVGLDAP